MRARLLAIALIGAGALVMISGLLLAGLTVIDMDPPYESTSPYLRLALLGTGIIGVGGSMLWWVYFGGTLREPDPFDLDVRSSEDA